MAFPNVVPASTVSHWELPALSVAVNTLPSAGEPPAIFIVPVPPITSPVGVHWESA